MKASRSWLLRIVLAVGIPAALFVALETGLRVAGVGRPASFLIPDEKPGFVRTNPDFASLFLPDSFDLRPLNFRISARKPPNTLRIVVLGESAAQGVPVPSFAFASQLRAQLRARHPGKEIEIINTGIVAINSHVVYRIACELARFEPDLFVVYMGNNEVVGPYGPGCAYLSQMPPFWVIRASVFVRSTRTGQLIGSLLGRLSRRAGRPAEWGGMSMFTENAVTGDDPRLEAVYGNFEANLRGILEAASDAGAKAIVCTVVANLKDCPPFLSRHRAGLAPSDLAAWEAAFSEGLLAWRLGDADRARARIGDAVRIDPQYADSHFILGSLDSQSGDTASARRHYIDALHWDALRFRPDPRINQIIRKVAFGGRAGVSLVDAALLLGSDAGSAAPPCGREILFEHVHFDWNGNYLLAQAIAQVCAVNLFGGSGGSRWMDSTACADAMAYTPHERLPMLLRIEVLTRKPPFSNQLTYVEDEARMTRAINEATRSAKEPATLSRAADVAQAALARDPDNPALAGILEGIDLDLGDLKGALKLAHRAELMLPRDFAPAADEASVLMRLGRFAEAERVLLRSVESGADLAQLAPVFAEFWTRTRRFEDGRRFFDGAIAQRPGDQRLRVERAGLLRAAGDVSGSERELRAILAGDPANEDALEGLVEILAESGRREEAGKESLAAADRQPRNQDNNVRAAKVCEAGGDETGSVRYLEAAERSGPVNATFELTLALKLYRLRRMPEMMTHLAEARVLSAHEGDPAVTASIGDLIARMRRETEAGAAPRK
jgi:tetratricopeptide (TPR) repeat protein